MKTFKEYINESKPMVFDIDNTKTGERLFSSSKGNAADLVDKKLKQAKFKKVLKELKITRTEGKDVEDVTKLFIK